MAHSFREARRMIDKVMDTYEVQPLFYTVSGSHLYGWSSEESDLDIRGVHLVPLMDYLSLESPIHDIKINQGKITEGFEEFDAMDLSSWSLKKFLTQILKGSYNPYEWTSSHLKINDYIPSRMEKLRNRMLDILPYTLPKSYYGMAHNNWHEEYIEREPKLYLYAFKGLLGAIFVDHIRDIHPSPLRMARELGDEASENLIEDLIDLKRTNSLLSVQLAGEIDTRLKDLEKRASEVETEEAESFHSFLDNWMIDVRKEVGDL